MPIRTRCSSLIGPVRRSPATRSAKLFDRLSQHRHRRSLRAHARHTWATNYQRSAGGSRFDPQAEGGWRTGRMVERYTKSRPFGTPDLFLERDEVERSGPAACLLISLHFAVQQRVSENRPKNKH